MRLIDADALIEVMNGLEYRMTIARERNATGVVMYSDNVVLASDAINAVSAVRSVDICRCSDCKHWNRNVHDRGDDSRCVFHNREIGSEGYCAWGQRREDGDGDG